MGQLSNVEAAPWQRQFLTRHQLPDEYLETAQQWFVPLAESLASRARQASAPLVVGLNGSQGSGKTTLSDYLQAHWREHSQLCAVTMSLDDFYQTRAARQVLANQVHPLFATRGVPGTHDMPLLNDVLQQLITANSGSKIAIPGFDKAKDDRLPKAHWQVVTAPIDIILLEGWCLGAEALTQAELRQAQNTLEQQEDHEGIWRGAVNQAIQASFLPLYELIDVWVMLAAPSFECVLGWRKEQEQKLRVKLQQSGDENGSSGVMSDEQLERFVAHFERLTRHCLNHLPNKVDHLFKLDSARRIVAYEQSRVPER